MIDVTSRERILLKEFVDVAGSAAGIANLCFDDPTWLSLMATNAEAQASRSHGGRLADGQLCRKLTVEVLGIMRRGSATLAWVQWTMPDSALRPVFDAELEVAPLETGRCRLTLSGSYLAPFDSRENRLGPVVMQRLAQSSIQNFLRGVAEALQADASALGGRHAGDDRGAGRACSRHR